MPDSPHPLVHFAEDGDTSGFFPALAKYHDRTRYSMAFGTLKPTTPELADFMAKRGVPTFSCGARSRLTYGRTVLQLARKLRKDGCRIFHAHLFDPSVVGLTAAALARVPLRILTRHYSNYHTRINRPAHVALDRLCTRLSHRVIAVSQETADHLVQIEHAPRPKVVTIHNGIDFDRVRTSGEGVRERVRRELGLGETFVFLMAGRLHPEKGYEILFDALRELVWTPTPFVVLVAGRGNLMNHYQALAGRMGLSDCVRLLGFRQDLPDLMTAADVFVLPSIAESFGLVLAEALYLGRPVVATRTGGIPEIVDDGIDGTLVPPGDPNALAAALNAHLQGRVSLPGQGEAARRKVRERFDFRQMLKGYEAVYASHSPPE